MKLNRHLKRNLARPIDSRLSLEGEQERTYGRRLNSLAWRTLAMVRTDIEPKVIELRKKQDLLDRILRISNGIESQGYGVCLGDKYSGHVYQTGTIDNHLASLNDSFYSVRSQAMSQARQDTIASANAVSQSVNA